MQIPESPLVTPLRRIVPVVTLFDRDLFGMQNDGLINNEVHPSGANDYTSNSSGLHCRRQCSLFLISLQKKM